MGEFEKRKKRERERGVFSGIFLNLFQNKAKTLEMKTEEEQLSLETGEESSIPERERQRERRPRKTTQRDGTPQSY